VVLNLLSNSLKFTDEGGRILIKGLLVKQGDYNYLEVSVMDTGIGISKENQEKLFTMFGFLEDSSERNSHGIGLGLAISQQIVMEFGGGKIDLISEIGEGSTFTFKF
jgi:two-component system, sensor histidine kinase ChiS